MVSPGLTIGALQVGVLISTFLFGITTLQTHIYMGRFSHDSVVIKLMVSTVWILELIHTIAVSQGLYAMVITQYIDPQHDFDRGIDPGFRIAVLFSGCIAALVQAYFTHRLRILSGSIILAIIFWAFAALRLVGWVWASIAGIIESLQLQSENRFDSAWEWPLVPLLALGACVDVTLAASVCYYFKKSQDKVTNTSHLIEKLMLWTIQNGLITGIAGLATAACLHTMRNNFVWIAVFMILTRLFSNSFLASLNARQHLRKYSQQYNLMPYAGGKLLEADEGSKRKLLYLQPDPSSLTLHYR